MTNEKITPSEPPDTAAKIQAMALSTANRTKYARFCDLFTTVEAALVAGVSREAIRQVLVGDGLDLSPAMLKNYLQRARARHDLSKVTNSISTAAALPPTQRTGEPRSEAKDASSADDVSWSPRALAELRNHPDDLDALIRSAKARKGKKKNESSDP